MNRFTVGQLVRVVAVRHCIAMVLTSNKGRTQVRFADLPPLVNASVNPLGLVEKFSNDDLTLVENVPSARFYLWVTIAERNGEQDYTHDCLAYGRSVRLCRLEENRLSDTPEQVAEAIASHWYGEGTWDETEAAYVFLSDRLLTASLVKCKSITVAEYIVLSDVLPDCTVQ